MATLADELLADLMSSGSEDFDDADSDLDKSPGDDVMDEEATVSTPQAEDELHDENVDREFIPLKNYLKDVKASMHLTQCLSELLKSSEQTLLQKANALTSALEDEIVAFHKTIRDHYSVRFPELEQLVQNPIQYVKAVGSIGNGPMDKISPPELKEFLDGSLVMAVKMEAIRTSGTEMAMAEEENVQRLVDMTLHLDAAKQFLTHYVKSRINQIAPNLTVLLGPETAAQLVSSAGGLTALAKIPACNIPAMGSKQATQGLATNTRVRRQGHLYYSPLVQLVPSDHRNQAMRIVSAKCSLAVRCDMVHSTPDGSTGEKLRSECEERIEKLTAKAPNARTRALPAPDDKLARKRGGRRARKAKEQYAMTELRKAQNRMAFGKEEAEVGVGDETEGLGMIGQANDGRIRAMAVDQRTKAKLSKKNPGWGTATSGGSGLASSLRGFGQGAGNATSLQGHGLRSSGVGTIGGAGITSVIAFTPFQGLELVNPKAKVEMDRKRKAEDDRWFKSGTFTQVGGGPTLNVLDPKIDSTGFKVPALPAQKRVKNEK